MSVFQIIHLCFIGVLAVIVIGIIGYFVIDYWMSKSIDKDLRRRLNDQ